MSEASQIHDRNKDMAAASEVEADDALDRGEEAPPDPNAPEVPDQFGNENWTIDGNGGFLCAYTYENGDYCGLEWDHARYSVDDPHRPPVDRRPVEEDREAVAAHDLERRRAEIIATFPVDSYARITGGRSEGEIVQVKSIVDGEPWALVNDPGDQWEIRTIHPAILEPVCGGCKQPLAISPLDDEVVNWHSYCATLTAHRQAPCHVCTRAIGLVDHDGKLDWEHKDVPSDHAAVLIREEPRDGWPFMYLGEVWAKVDGAYRILTTQESIEHLGYGWADFAGAVIFPVPVGALR